MSIVDYCEAMKTFPHKGMRRDDVRPGLRISNVKGRTVIAFVVDELMMSLSIIGIFYGGQDYGTHLAG